MGQRCWLWRADTLGSQSGVGLPGVGRARPGQSAQGPWRGGSGIGSGARLEDKGGAQPPSRYLGPQEPLPAGPDKWGWAWGSSPGQSPRPQVLHLRHTAFTCPAGKVYQPCGPADPSYCYGSSNASIGYALPSLLGPPRAPRLPQEVTASNHLPHNPCRALQDAGHITEGCFCPQGMTLFSASSEVCVPTNCSSTSP